MIQQQILNCKLFTNISDTKGAQQVAPTVDLFPDSNIDSGKPPLHPGVKVLIIGDSHTAGIYGAQIDKLARSSGATVQTYGSCGSSPSWWFNSTSTQCGFYAHDEKGQTIRKNVGEKTPTPNLNNLINKYKPDVVIVSLGANMIRANENSIINTSKKMAQTIQQSGAKLFWVGPPKGRESKKSTEDLNRLYDALQKAMPDNTVFIDSRPYTYYPEKGGDGVHFSGKEGKQIATNWAEQVFNKIQSQKT